MTTPFSFSRARCARQDAGHGARHLLGDQREAAAPLVYAAREFGLRARYAALQATAHQRGVDDVRLERAEHHVLRERALEIANPIAECDREKPQHAAAMQLARLLRRIENLQVTASPASTSAGYPMSVWPPRSISMSSGRSPIVQPGVALALIAVLSALMISSVLLPSSCLSAARSRPMPSWRPSRRAREIHLQMRRAESGRNASIGSRGFSSAARNAASLVGEAGPTAARRRRTPRRSRRARQACAAAAAAWTSPRLHLLLDEPWHEPFVRAAGT